jgi:hypothetical protein
VNAIALPAFEPILESIGEKEKKLNTNQINIMLYAVNVSMVKKILSPPKDLNGVTNTEDT